MGRFIRNKNHASDEEIIVDRHISTSYDVVRAVYDALSEVTNVSAALDAGTFDDLITQADMDAAIEAAVTGLVEFKGSYDIAGDSPGLVANPASVYKGDMYVITVAGTFYGTEMQVGDSIIAAQDAPTEVGHWTLIEFNLDPDTFLQKSATLVGTDDETAWSMEYTVNKGFGDDTGILLNKIDTNSPGTSYLIDAQVGGVSQFRVDNGGRVSSGAGYTYGQPQFYDHSIGSTSGILITGQRETSFFRDGRAIMSIGDLAANGIRVNSTTGLGWTTDHALTGAPDTGLSRESAGLVKVTDPNGTDGYGYIKANRFSAGINSRLSMTSTGVITTNTGDQSIQILNLGRTSSSSVGHIKMTPGVMAHSSGDTIGFEIAADHNQSGTAGSTDLLINRTETAVGSGAQYLIDAQVDGVRTFAVNSRGRLELNDPDTGAINMQFIGDFGQVYFGYNNTDTTLFAPNKTGEPIVWRYNSQNTQTSGANALFAIKPTYNQASGTASNTDLLINRTETAVGSGDQYLIDAQVGGTSKFSVDNLGAITFHDATGEYGLTQNGLHTRIDGRLGVDFAARATTTSTIPAFDFKTLSGGFNASSGNQTWTRISPHWNQSGTAGATDLLINRTETAVGSGAQYLIDAQVGGTSKFSVDNAGRISSGAGYAYGQPQFYDHSISSTTGVSVTGTRDVTVYGDGNAAMSVSNLPANGVRIANDIGYNWTSGHALSSSPDTGLVRDSAGVVKVTDGGAGAGNLIVQDLTVLGTQTGGGGGGGGGGMTALVKGENYTAAADEQVLVTSDTGTWTITLPASPTTGDKVSVWDCGDNAGSNVITVARNGNTINGAAEDFLINMDGGRWDGVYDGTTWEYSYVIQTTQPQPSVAETSMDWYPGQMGTQTGGPAIPYVDDHALGVTGSGLTTCYPPYRAFDASNNSKLFWTGKMPADWDGDTNTVYFHITWFPDNTNTQDCLWWFGMGDLYVDLEQSGLLIMPTAANGTQYQLQTTTGQVNLALRDVNPGDEITMTLQRRAADAGDTFTGNAHFVHCSLSYRRTSESIGTAIANTSSMVTRNITGTTDTILASDNGKTLVYTNAAAVAVTLPDGLPVDFQCTVMQYGAGTVTVTPATDTVNGAGTGVSPAAQYDSLYLGKVEATGWVAVS